MLRAQRCKPIPEMLWIAPRYKYRVIEVTVLSLRNPLAKTMILPQYLVVRPKAKAILAIAATLLISFCCYVTAEPLHDQINEAIIGLASKDATVKQRSIDFLLAAPPVFRENMAKQYLSEAEELAKSLPQRIDGYTTLQSIFVGASETLVQFVIDYDRGELTGQEQQQLKLYLADQSRKQVCGFGGSVLLSLLYGRDFVRHYAYQTGEPFFSARVTWSDCE